jgi:hypothetical protein
MAVVVMTSMACSDDGPPLAAVAGPGLGFSPPVGGDNTSFSSGPIPGSAVFGGAFVNNPARAMVTGTLATTSDGEFAVAADSERDELVRVALISRTMMRVPLAAGDEPGRTVAGKVDEDGAQTYTVLRGASAIAVLSVTEGEVVRVPTCQAPRGVAYDAAANLVHVACATSELVSYDADTWETVRHIAVARDLRDVVVTERGLLVSRFASAELLLVGDDGEVSVIGEPRVPPACTQPTVMHRIVAQGAYLYAAHQLATTDVVLGRNGVSDCSVAQSASVYWRTPLQEVIDLVSAGSPDAGPQTGETLSYWEQFVTTSDQVPPRDESSVHAQDAHHLAQLGASAGPMDLAVSATGRAVVSLAGNFWQDAEPTIVTWDHDDVSKQVRLSAYRTTGMVTSVGFDAAGKWIAQSREPAALFFEDGGAVFFGGKSVNNTSYSLFHMNSGTGVSCASCHPEGGQDEHVWRFPRGLRRTLPLGQTMAGQGAYDWDASSLNIDDLLRRVLNQQMSHDFRATWEQGLALETWLGRLPAPSPGVVTNIGAVERGRGVFVASGCATCHAGETYTDDALHDLGTGARFKTPSLLGVGGRSQLLHDGCAEALPDVLGACGGDATHQILDRSSAQQVSDLVAFLTTL